MSSFCIQSVATPHTFNLCSDQHSLYHHDECEYYRRLLRGNSGEQSYQTKDYTN